MRRLHLVITAVDDPERAATMARQLVSEDLVACAQVGSPVRSFYRWQGVLEEAAEVPLVLKVRHDRVQDCLAWLTAHHPYDNPELASWPADGVADAYLAWAYGEGHP